MNISEQYPNQKRQLKKAQDDWEKAIIERGDPPVSGDSLDGMQKDYYGDITEKYKKTINEIIAKSTAEPVVKSRTYRQVLQGK